jgi:hypothetical protein
MHTHPRRVLRVAGYTGGYLGPTSSPSSGPPTRFQCGPERQPRARRTGRPRRPAGLSITRRTTDGAHVAPRDWPAHGGDKGVAMQRSATW